MFERTCANGRRDRLCRTFAIAWAGDGGVVGKVAAMKKSFPTYLAVGATALTVGGIVGTAMTATPDTKNASETVAAAPVPEQVRTQTVTRTIHRVRKVHVKAKPKHRAAAAAPAPAPAPAAPAAVAPAPVAPAPRVRTSVPVSVPIANSAPARPAPKPTIKSRTSGGSAGGEREDDGHEREYEHEGGEYEGGDD